MHGIGKDNKRQRQIYEQKTDTTTLFTDNFQDYCRTVERTSSILHITTYYTNAMRKYTLNWHTHDTIARTD